MPVDLLKPYGRIQLAVTSQLIPPTIIVRLRRMCVKIKFPPFASYTDERTHLTILCSRENNLSM